MWERRVLRGVRLVLDPASRKLLEFGLIGLVLAGALALGVESKPANILPVNGTLIVEITDAPFGNNQGFPCGDCVVTSVNVTIGSVKVHRAGVLDVGGESIEVLKTSVTLDLLKVTSPTQLGSLNVHEGQITFVRLHVVEAKAMLMGRPRVVVLAVPSGDLKVNFQSFATVKAGLTTSIVIDFQPHVVCQRNDDCRLTPVLAVKEVRGP